ncbi:heparinase II/III family protein [Coprinopsis cinerea okayama7|uniref:Heparinase II/III family protein n=1 Tax=Coprinopsis cinerea (strain Okayama-7 / 130 / ATCC MYA-4618 / FGSC 9003) TaxID=240176 RepID=A8N2B0_COPC7|nr:heparinase II/III family protein [Coprinopsis cinerea okayama7\|eukprot:XP_001829070.1 heparinase II/III family protein [Coprinopsis cinerea okayama7\
MSSNYNYSGLGHNGGGYSDAAGNPAYKESTGFAGQQAPAKKPLSKWVKFGIPAAVVIILAAVLGGVLGSRAVRDKDDGNSGSASGGSSSDSADPETGGTNAEKAIGRFATATDSKYMIPVYPSTTNTAAFTSPTFAADAKVQWPEDPFKPTTPNVLAVREDRPRIIAPQYKWDALPDLIRNDPYLEGWNETIFGNATDYLERDPVPYFMDGDSGILDVAREIKQRIKAFGYAYRMTKDTRWSERAWRELQNAASDEFGPAEDKWNPSHFLDAAELSAAFGIAYDWFHDVFSDEQKGTLRDILIRYGLRPGLDAYSGAASYGWWRTGVNGNWNCVCNGGLTIGALAILGDDATGVAEEILGLTVDNARENCALGPSDDGTWSETKNYWYFGTTGHAEMVSALLTATGSDYGLLSANPGFALTGLAHMYGFGATSLFDYGDHGPNKYSATANCMFLYSEHYERPQYALFQREQFDAAEPWSMFWYNPSVSGAFWDGAALDHFFDNALDQWASMRSSWTDSNALYVAIKAGSNQGHQAHNDLDVGDFVLDALGTRWAGELGSADYLAPGYFSSDAQDSVRWLYYRKMTAGQNTIVINGTNQNVEAAPSIRHDSSGTAQGSSTVLQVPNDSTAFWVTDMTSAYFSATSVKRGIRLLNGRRQVLLQDEIDASGSVQWRMHTNATVEVEGTSATLSLDGESMRITLLSPPEGAEFSTGPAQRSSSDPTPPVADQENPGVTVLAIDLPAGRYTLQVLFNPQWPGMSDGDFVTPPSVALDDWSLTSHN